MAAENQAEPPGAAAAPSSVGNVTVHPIAEADARVGRVVGRLTTEFFLRTARLLADLSGGDLLEALVLRAIGVANTAHLDHDPKNPGRFASIDDVPPDELRRPISVLAIAGSLGLPYETTRRYANKLVASGQCTRVKGGLIARYRPEDNPAILLNMASLRRLNAALRMAGVALLD